MDSRRRRYLMLGGTVQVGAPPTGSARADARLLEDHHSSLQQRGFHLIEVRQEKSQVLAGVALGASAEQNDGRSRTVCQGKQRAEIRVGGYDYAGLGRSAVQHFVVCSSMQPIVSHMNGIMAGGAQASGQPRRQRVVNQELHAADAAGMISGCSRSRKTSAA
jgi:hypothetical protein